MSAIGKKPVVTAVIPAGALNPQPNGTVTLTINNTTMEVLSVQPDGSFETRPPGTTGAYEIAYVNGNTLVYCPDGQHVYVFPYFKDCPNV